ncbi:MAG: hypothetical protein U9R25_03365 [Chloroflexota bacterium]|nr:hypothetical protein [Chloroflexota bacterium]
MAEKPSQVIVATYESPSQAKRAWRTLNRTDDPEQIQVQDAAVVSRDLFGETHIQDAYLMSLGELARDTAGIAFNVGLSSAGLLLETAIDGTLILIGGGRKMAGLAGSALISTVRQARTVILPNRSVEAIGETLDPGAAAVVMVVESDQTADLAARLAKSGALVTVQDQHE